MTLLNLPEDKQKIVTDILVSTNHRKTNQSLTNVANWIYGDNAEELFETRIKLLKNLLTQGILHVDLSVENAHKLILGTKKQILLRLSTSLQGAITATWIKYEFCQSLGKKANVYRHFRLICENDHILIKDSNDKIQSYHIDNLKAVLEAFYCKVFECDECNMDNCSGYISNTNYY